MLAILESKKNKIIAIAIASLFIISAIFILISGKTEFTDNAYLKSDIVIIRPRVTGYITKVTVNDNQKVKEGQLLAKIDDRDYLLKLTQAEENLKSAIAKVESLDHQIQIQNYETDSASFSLNAAEANLIKANQDLSRAQELIKSHAISQAALEKAKELQNNAKNMYATANANFAASTHKQKIISLNRDEAIALQKNHESAVNLAKIDLKNTEIRAATDGKISKRAMQVGQLASPNMALGYLVNNNIWVIANFKEVQIGQMRLNQQAIVTIDSIKGKKFKARVNSASPATGSEFSILPAENATGNFTKIVQRVPIKLVFEDHQDLSALRPGLSCEVKVIF